MSTNYSLLAYVELAHYTHAPEKFSIRNQDLSTHSLPLSAKKIRITARTAPAPFTIIPKSRYPLKTLSWKVLEEDLFQEDTADLRELESERIVFLMEMWDGFWENIVGAKGTSYSSSDRECRL